MGGAPAVTAPAHERDDPHRRERDEASLVQALGAGDEVAFLHVLDQYHAPLLRFASIYLTAADGRALTHELWLTLVDALAGCDGREAFNVWLYRLLLERIRLKLVSNPGGVLRRFGLRRAQVSIPHARSWTPSLAQPVAAVESTRFLPAHHDDAGGWAKPPVPWRTAPSTAARDRERLLCEVARLPHAEREVVTLRDIEGWSAAEVCNFLGVSETNQRALLHRGRSAVRRALEQHFVKQSNHD
jgi:RNA polymerase sigma-70 factor, ECF subfamily